MPRYYFNVHDGKSFFDAEGTELPNLDTAKREAIAYSAKLLADNVVQFRDGEPWAIDVTDESGLVLFSLIFAAFVPPTLRGTSRLPVGST